MTAYSDVSGLKYEETSASLGDQLRAGRAARGLSLADVESDLRIKSHYVDAIESGDLSALPGKVYVDGFVRNYASYLGLDPTETLARFDAETGFAAPKGKTRRRSKEGRTDTTANPLAGYESKRPRGAASGEIGRTIAALWPLVVLAGLGYGIWYGVMAARDAGIIPDNLSVIGATDEQQPTFSANISDEEIGRLNGDDTIERPADLSYARLGTPPYWTLPEDELDGPVSKLDIALVGLFASHREMVGGSAMVRNAAPLDLTVQPAGLGEDIAAQTREALLAPAGVDPTADIVPTGPSTFRDYALVATEETWIEVRTASGGISFSGILAAGDVFDIPAEGSPSLKVGNAGGLVLELEGKRLGPFGGRGVVMRRIDLGRNSLAERFADTVSATLVQ